MLGTAAGDGVGLKTSLDRAAGPIDDVVTAIASCNDIDTVVGLGLATQTLHSRCDATIVAMNIYSDWLSSLGNHVAQAGSANFTTFPAWLQYYNLTYATKWSLMVPYTFAEVYYACLGARLPWFNVWWEILQGSTYTNGAGKLNYATPTAITDGAAADDTLYAGGLLKIKLVGCTFTGTVTLTITGKAVSPTTAYSTGTFESGKTWVVTLTSADNGSSTKLVPVGTATADSLCCDVTAMSASGGTWSAGDIYAELHRPAGRDEA
jgi:hypothetical protein